jgi:hypothetical protein
MRSEMDGQIEAEFNTAAAAGAAVARAISGV